MRTIDRFCGKEFGYPVNKTLTYELKPLGKTRENIEKNSIILNDKDKLEKSEKVKKYIDRLHRTFIERVLESHTIDLSELERHIENLAAITDEEGKRNERKEIRDIEDKKRQEISEWFTKDKEYKTLWGTELFTESLPKITSDEEKENIKTFEKFTQYFTGYNTKRESIYSPLERHNTIGFRIINENFRTFLQNKKNLREGIIENDEILKTFPLSTKDIEKYNSAISGNPAKKIKGYNQRANELKDKEAPYLKQLYKNILAESSPLFTVEKFTSTEEVKETVRAFIESIEPLKEKTENLVKIQRKYDKILIQKKNLAKFSLITTGKPLTLMQALKAKNKEVKDEISIKEIEETFIEAIKEGLADDKEGFNKEKYFALLEPLEKILSAIKKLNLEKITDLQGNKKQVQPLKDFLTTTLEFYNHLKVCSPSEESMNEKDEAFYSSLEEIKEMLSPVTEILNKTRNFTTTKLSEEQKIPLNFDTPTLLNGWDINKEYTNNAMIFHDEKEDAFILGILNNKNKKKIIEKEGSGLKKMYYKYLPQPNKMIPHVVFSKKGLENFKPSEEILEGYKKGIHKKGESFDINFCHKLIDFFKDCIAKTEDWKVFDFKFSPTESYKDLSDFYSEINEQGYCITMKEVDRENLQKMNEEDSIYLFKITNRFLEKKAHGKSTREMILRALFDTKSNIQLNGNAEIFFRPQLIEPVVTHPKGSWLVNKQTKSGLTVPENTFRNIYNHLNRNEKLTEESQLLIDSGEIIYKKADRDIIKNARYSRESFRFHMPVTLNYKFRSAIAKTFNDSVRSLIQNDKSINILAITRGENNLIYCVLMNQENEVLLEKSFNIMESSNKQVNFKHKLKTIEEKRMKEREEWQEITKIADTKKGYLALVISEITKIMVENNAILVTEDLSSDFKDSRMKIETNTYKTFETELINKLSCFYNKHKEKGECGSIENPYQLTPPAKDFTKAGTQFGWVFFLNPAYISKISPETGFINIFRFKDITNFEKRKKFLGTFKRITLNKDALELEYEMSDFNKDFKGTQTLVLNGSRNLWSKEEKKYSEIDLNKTVKTSLSMIDCDENTDITEKIKRLPFTLTNNTALELLIKGIEAASNMKTFSTDDYLYVDPTGNSSQINNKSMDFIASLNLAKKMNIMLKDEKIKPIKTKDYIKKLSE